MPKLSKRQLLQLTPEAQTLARAGFIDICDGKLREPGRSAMWLILTRKHMPELIKEAEEVIKEAEKEQE